MERESSIRSVLIQHGRLEELADRVELGVARAQEEGFRGVEEGASDLPGGGERIEFIDHGEEELNCYLGFLL